MKRFAWLLVLVIPIVITGCFSANMLEMDALKPGDFTVPVSVKSLAVVSRCDLDSAYKLTLQVSGRRRDFNNDSIMAKQVVLGCSDALLESPRFKLFNPIIHRNLEQDFNTPPAKIPWDAVRVIAGDPPVDGVLALEGGVMRDTVTYRLLDGWFNSWQYRVIVKTFWRMYDLSDFQSKEFSFTDTMAYDIDSPADFTSSPDMKISCVKDAMYESGNQTAKRLAPWWTSFERYYFSTGPLNFLNGAEFLKKAQWQESAEIWRTYTESKHKKIAAKACFNMALTCEMANKIPAAFEWLKKSEELGMHEFYINDYLAKLAKRKVETNKLDLQMR